MAYRYKLSAIGHFTKLILVHETVARLVIKTVYQHKWEP